MLIAAYSTSRVPAELLLANGGADVSGKFLFRARTGTDEHVLSVIYKAQATHHKVALGSGGDLEVNGQPTGCTDIVQVRPWRTGSTAPSHIRVRSTRWTCFVVVVVL